MGHMVSDVSELLFHSDVPGKKHRTNSFFNVPGLFVGLSPKSSESDSVRSPTSPLDLRLFTNLGNPFRSPRSSQEDHQKSWEGKKVGLCIINSLDDETKQSGKVLRSSDSKNILFGAQMRVKAPHFRSQIDSLEAPKSLPKDVAIFPYGRVKSSNYKGGNSGVLFGIGGVPSTVDSFGEVLSCSLDSSRSNLKSFVLANCKTNSSSWNFVTETRKTYVNSPLHFTGGSSNSGNSSNKKLISMPVSSSSDNVFIGTLSASEIELSEDYTCVRTHGPNPKTTHIFGDCILECHNNEFIISPKNEEQKISLLQGLPCSEVPSSCPSNGFLSVCYSCKKKLDGKDIYMYRGEKAFCSCSCRSEEILIEEAKEKIEAANDKDNDSSENNIECNSQDKIFETGLFIAT